MLSIRDCSRIPHLFSDRDNFVHPFNSIKKHQIHHFRDCSRVPHLFSDRDNFVHPYDELKDDDLRTQKV